jgi:hypothetical protein
MKIPANSQLAADAATFAAEDGLPASLVRVAETAADAAKRAASAAKHAERIAKEVKQAEDPGKSDAAAALELLRKAKTKGRIEKMKAKASGATKAMPLSGKEALKVIQGDKPANGSPGPKLLEDLLNKPFTRKAKPAKAKAAPKAPKAPQKAKGAPKAPKAKVTKAKAEKRTSEPRKAAAGGAKNKVALIGELLRRKQGCTREDVLAATGWPSVSMPQQARALGVELRKVKNEGEVTRYFAG